MDSKRQPWLLAVGERSRVDIVRPTADTAAVFTGAI